MKNIKGNISLEHEDFLIILDKIPEMEDLIEMPIYGKGTVSGLNNEYKGTEQTWIMVQWQDKSSTQFQYLLLGGKPL